MNKSKRILQIIKKALRIIALLLLMLIIIIIIILFFLSNTEEIDVGISDLNELSTKSFSVIEHKDYKLSHILVGVDTFYEKQDILHTHAQFEITSTAEGNKIKYDVEPNIQELLKIFGLSHEKKYKIQLVFFNTSTDFRAKILKRLNIKRAIFRIQYFTIEPQENPIPVCKIIKEIVYKEIRDSLVNFVQKVTTDDEEIDLGILYANLIQNNIKSLLNEIDNSSILDDVNVCKEYFGLIKNEKLEDFAGFEPGRYRLKEYMKNSLNNLADIINEVDTIVADKDVEIECIGFTDFIKFDPNKKPFLVKSKYMGFAYPDNLVVLYGSLSCNSITNFVTESIPLNTETPKRGQSRIDKIHEEDGFCKLGATRAKVIGLYLQQNLKNSTGIKIFYKSGGRISKEGDNDRKVSIKLTIKSAEITTN